MLARHVSVHADKFALRSQCSTALSPWRIGELVALRVRMRRVGLPAHLLSGYAQQTGRAKTVVDASRSPASVVNGFFVTEIRDKKEKHYIYIYIYTHKVTHILICI